MMQNSTFLIAWVALLILFALSSAAPAAPGLVSRPYQSKNKEKKMPLDQMIANPSQVMGTCSYQVKGTPHTLTMIRAQLPSLSTEEYNALIKGAPQKDFDKYGGNFAYLVIDTTQSSVPRSKVVWGKYVKDSTLNPQSSQKLMGDFVWSAKTNTAYVILGQTDRGHSVSIYVYQVNLANDLAPLPLKLGKTYNLSSFRDVQPLVETECGTGLTEVKSVHASATPDGLQLHFLRDYLYENSAEEFKAPIDVSLNLTTHEWSSTSIPKASIGSSPVLGI